MKNLRVLVIEDDEDAADVLKAYLLRDEYDVEIAGNGLEGLEKVKLFKPNLILLDLMLPGMHGSEILTAVRRNYDSPVIVITASVESTDCISALRYAADDYIVKPYHPGEVAARVQSVLRRTQPHDQQEAVLRWQALEFNTLAMTAKVKQSGESPVSIELTPTECSILAQMLRSPQRVFSRQSLIETCIPESNASERVIDTHIFNLRRKLVRAGVTGIIVNIPSFGYRFDNHE